MNKPKPPVIYTALGRLTSFGYQLYSLKLISDSTLNAFRNAVQNPDRYNRLRNIYPDKEITE